MNKTKIDWCDMSWNPVTGCRHNCEYCYARKIARRFAGGGYEKEMGMFIAKYKEKIFQPPYELSEPQLAKTKDEWYREAPYPFGFEPTFHRYRLDEPKQKTKPRNIFVCSMADLFGDWVPDEWIRAVFDECIVSAPWHRYLFLTKNPGRYDSAIDNYAAEDRGCSDTTESFENCWFGTSVTSQADAEKIETLSRLPEGHRFLSIEPILGPVTLNLKKNRCPICGSDEVYRDNPKTCQGEKPWYCDCCGMWESEDGADLKPDIDWVIIGSETGNRKEKVIPQRAWIESIVADCRVAGIPVFMKSSLTDIWGAPLIQEFPWGDAHD
ncbi:DUF5131 family protein [Caproiciproducens sp. CPB-2]|uniref:DUF5131 family protein n=1 Tax=Caproiciproducens sp. CPB-2 TaxID=3030017 RepID=UPI0023DB8772|nr:DUF5131 family protein [Caproiciproducens sp. CPB-2]MDF1495204.1 DUF5131 family protein [Caproiciproducens sp. CPB-2]